MRRHLTPATLIAATSLFVSLSGAAVATATVLVSSNRQVASHVISGSVGTAAHKNLIRGSVGGPDLANGSIVASKLALPEYEFRGHDTDFAEAPAHRLLTLGGVTISASCSYKPEATTFSLYFSSTASDVTGTVTSDALVTDGMSAPTAMVLSRDVQPGQPARYDLAATGESWLQGQFIFRRAGRLIVYTLYAGAQHDFGWCTASGTALPASS